MPRGMGMEEMSKEDYQVMNRVRKEVWSNGIYGYAVGSSSGVLMHTFLTYFKKHVYPSLPMALNRNTLVASFFLGGTFGSFVLAAATGKNEVHKLYDIFPKGANPPPSKSYDQIREEAAYDAWKKEDKTLVERK